MTQAWTLQGRVYEGEIGDPSTPLQDVTVAVYGANATYPTAGTFIRDATTDATGWYGVQVSDDDIALYDYVYLLETDLDEGGGTVQEFADEINGVAPGHGVTIDHGWDTTGEPQETYGIVGYVTYDGLATDPMAVVVTTKEWRIYLPLVLRAY